MAALVERLKTASSGEPESAGFLNDILALMWPNINVASCKMIKQVVEPMLTAMLPETLKTLHFAKLDLGPVPIGLTNVEVRKNEDGLIRLDMDVNWDAKCEITLDGKMIPTVGIEGVKLKGRLSTLLGPLSNDFPLIGAAQVAFVNPPDLHLDFSEAASIADLGVISRTICSVVLDIIASMAVLPNRYMIKLDTTNDYRKTYQHHLGVLRLTIEKASGLGGRKVEKRGVKKLIEKLTKDTPDCYCDISVGAEGKWRTSTKNNDVNPVWNETHDFLVMDYEQCVYVDVQDDDLVGDDDIGIAVTTIRQLLLSGGKQELGLVHKGKPVEGATLTLSSSYLDFVSDPASLSDASATGSQICGLLTVLVASVYGIEGDREKLNPSVKVTWGDKEISTVAKTYSPGVDIFNPSFDTPFRWPVTAEILAKPPSLKVALMDKTVEAGSVEIPFAELLAAPGMTLERDFDVGSGPKIRASVTLRGTKLAE